MTDPTPDRTRHTLAEQTEAFLIDRKQPVPIVVCTCGWHGEVHVWAYHLNSEADR